jgi:penicillin-binding protein 2
MTGRRGAGADVGFEVPLRVVAAGIVLAFAIFFLRLVQLQVIQGEELAKLSERNRVRSTRVEAPRGDILDRDGEVLATTRPAFGVRVIPAELRKPDVTFAVLGRLLEREPQAIRERVGAPRGRAKWQPVGLDADLAWEKLARVESHRYALPGVVTDVAARRDYKGGVFAAHLMGTLGEVTAQQLETRAFAGYQPGEIVGQSGVEALLEPTLRGRAGGRNVVVDVAGREQEVIDEVEPVRGGTAMLTLDLDLQRAAWNAFVEAGSENAPAGAVVALDPRNGDVLALVSYPAYDPNAFAAGVDARLWKQLRDDEWKPLQNRAVAGQYPPGSTFKAIVAAAALEAGVYRPGERVYCPGHFRLGRRVYRCWKREGHGSVDLHDAIKMSCDVFFYTMGVRLGVDRLAQYARSLGLGATTGSPFSEERPGLIPTTAWKERRFKEKWIEGETVSASIGQGFDLTTPLQLAVAYAAIANGGKVVRPRLVLSRFDSEGALVDQPPVEVREQSLVSPKHLATVLSGLEAVVGEPRGTGGRARIAGVRVGGKTGTAQVVGLQHTEHLDELEVPLRYRDHALFVAVAPIDDPQIVVSVIAEHGRHGSSTAAPIAQKVLTAYFVEHGVIPPPAPPQTQAQAHTAGGPEVARGAD